MQMKRITTEHVNEPPPETWSNCKVAGDFVYFAGFTAGPRTGEVAGGDDMYAQSRIIFEKIRHLMEAAGGEMDDLVKVLIYLTDINDRDAVWKARREFFTGDYPVSTLIEISKLVRPELCVEIEAVGMLGAGRGTVDDTP